LLLVKYENPRFRPSLLTSPSKTSKHPTTTKPYKSPRYRQIIRLEHNLALSSITFALELHSIPFTMRSRTMSRRYSDGGASTSSASTSPERGIDDDNDSLMLHDNDSQSSLALSIPEEISDSLAREIAERCRVSPISRLPAELMIAIFQKLGSTADLKNCMLVSREWARNSVGLLWHRPQTSRWDALHNVVQSLRSAHAFFDYPHLVKRLNLSTLGTSVSDGTLQPFGNCKRIERLTLTGCSKLSDLSVARMVEGNRSLLALDVTSLEGVTDLTMNAVANNCFRLQGLNISTCRKITDESLINVARNCRHLKRV
jgi:F-box and leucine-rich repeat protein GRR1